MKFEERKILLKDGRTCVLKPNSPEYAQEMQGYLRKTSAETEYLLRYPDDVIVRLSLMTVRSTMRS